MLDSFNIAATGMHAQQLQVDVIANNLANVNTNGFKKSKVDFEDMMYRQVASAQGLLGSPDIDNAVGIGAAVASVGKVFSQGEVKSTDRALDIAIQGNGFMEVLLPDGSYAYTRTGNLQVNSEGVVVNNDGYQLSQNIQIPTDAEEIVIQSDGAFKVRLTGESGLLEIGQLNLAGFMNASGLTPSGDNLYIPSQSSGDAFYAEPGEDGLGTLAQGFLEGSNVNLVEELTNMVVAQRGYEMNAKVIQTADDMLSIVNNLRR